MIRIQPCNIGIESLNTWIQRIKLCNARIELKWKNIAHTMHVCPSHHNLSLISMNSLMHVSILPLFWEFILFDTILYQMIMFWKLWSQGNTCMLCFQRFDLRFAQLACFWALILQNDFEFLKFDKFTQVPLSFWPKRTWFVALSLSLKLKSKFENSRILLLRLNDRSCAQATT